MLFFHLCIQGNGFNLTFKVAKLQNSPGEYEDETEEESEVEGTEKKEVPVKTLVSDLPPEKNKGDEITRDEPAPSTTKVCLSNKFCNAALKGIES